MLTSRFEPADMQKLSRAFRAVAAATKRDARPVILAFAGVILKTWAGRTKVATAKRTDERSRAHVVKSLGLTKAGSIGDVTVNAGIKGIFGRVWVKTAGRRGSGRPFRMATQISSDGSTFRWAKNYHWSNKQYADISEATLDVIGRMPKAIDSGRAAIGLARQSVIQIADSLGIDLNRVAGGGSLSAAGIAKARSAIATTGKRYSNGLGTEENAVAGFFVVLINNYPLAEKLQMDRTLQGVLSGQIKYFEKNIELGVFKSQSAVARAYPFLVPIP